MSELYRGKHISVENKEIILPNGRNKEGFIVHPGDAVAVLPVEGTSCYLLSQYRYCIEDYIIEVPAGKCEPGESPLSTAKRELAEETNFAAAVFTPLGKIFTTPGYSDEVIHLFLAEGLTHSSNYLMDDDEIIEVRRFSFEEVKDMIKDGRITDAKTICLFFKALQ